MTFAGSHLTTRRSPGPFEARFDPLCALLNLAAVSIWLRFSTLDGWRACCAPVAEIALSVSLGVDRMAGLVRVTDAGRREDAAR